MKVTKINNQSVFPLPIGNYVDRVNTDGGTVENLRALQDAKGSICIIPSGKKIGKIYAVNPTNGTGDIAITRASEGTYIDKNGTLITAPINEPRFDWSSGEAEILIEDTSTNVNKYSNDFSQAYWVREASIVLTTGYKSPFNTLDATKITGAVGASYIYGSDSSITGSVWVRTVVGDGYVHLVSRNGAVNLFHITEEWQRIGKDINDNNYLVDFRGAGVTLSEIIVYEAQAETLGSVSSNIPTTTVAVTRSADVVTAINVPADVIKITEYGLGWDNVIVVIPATYTIPVGRFTKIEMVVE